ncbi:MAG: preprotein translocase subunit YajC [Lachnospiraceae bacterium]|nr:preprotein translocase subunit YajC [Lachnospiraceae bacterium]
MAILLTGTAQTGVQQMLPMILWIIVLGGLMYFMFYRPQKKEQAKRDAMLAEVQVGSAVLTTSGFYGIIIDIPDEETVIVEFGSNKNCRIPMKKAAIQEVERPGAE